MPQPGNRVAPALVLYGAHVSGQVISSTRNCIHHGNCHALGARGGLGHSEANSIILPYAMCYNTPVAAPQL